jgi:hypothetical protein
MGLITLISLMFFWILVIDVGLEARLPAGARLFAGPLLQRPSSIDNG